MLKSSVGWLCIAGVVFLCSCSRRDTMEARSDPPQATVVAVAKAKHEDLSRQLTLTAEFRPFQEIDIHSKVAGYVKKIYVDVGDRVQEGQLLAVLEIPEMQDDITRAVGAQRRSLAELARARDELVRSQSAHEASHLSYTRLASVIKVRPNLVAQQEIDEALARDRVSEAQIASAKEALAAAEQGVQVARADEEKVKTLAAYFAHHRAFCRRHYEALRGYGRHDPGRHGLPDADHASGAAFRRPTSPPGASGARIRGAPDPRGRAGYGDCAFAESQL